MDTTMKKIDMISCLRKCKSWQKWLNKQFRYIQSIQNEKRHDEKNISTSTEYLIQVGDIREGFSEKAASRLSTQGRDEVRKGQKLF